MCARWVPAQDRNSKSCQAGEGQGGSGREPVMSTVFEVPCPECGRRMAVAAEDELQCPTCERTYHARMGHLFPVGEPGTGVVYPESRPGRGQAGRPTAATS